VCSRIEHLTSEVEGEALSALDALTKKVSKHTLEHVRRVKNCMVRLNARAEALHDLLEKLVDSHTHMRDMILTAKPQGISSLEEANLSKHPQVCFADVQKVEMLLETYSMHIYNTYNKLQFLKEYIDDTEDFVNIELDGQRNQLIKIGLVLTTGTFAVGLINAVAGIFGMNLDNGHEVGQEDSRKMFLVVTLIVVPGALLTFAATIAFLRFKKLIGT
ncbi:TPA: hypothetical protein ACH3X1_011567, partial [Trebouxia sp. C0004]